MIGDARTTAQQTPPLTVAPTGPEIENLERLALDDLLPRVREIAAEGGRFVTATCCDLGDACEVLYHFDRDLELRHLSVTVPAGGRLPSISGIYLCAFLVENEMRDLFGLPVDGIALDYQGRLLLTADSPPAPMRKQK